MEENNIHNKTLSTSEGVCLSCGSENIDIGYTTPLCSSCRQKAKKYPFPIWGGILICGLLTMSWFSLSSFSDQIVAGVQFRNATKAEKKRDYLTAQKVLSEILERDSSSQEAASRLLIAAFYNLDLKTFYETAAILQGKVIADKQMYRRLDKLLYNIRFYTPSEKFHEFTNVYEGQTIPDTIYRVFLFNHPDDVYAMTCYSQQLQHQERYRESDSIVTKALEIDEGNIRALLIKANTKRLLTQYDSALHYCRIVLQMNRELPNALAVKARTLLQMGKKADALVSARSAVVADPDDPYTGATLALALHFNGNKLERDSVVSHFSTDSAGSVYMKYVEDVIQGREKFIQE